MFLVLMGVVGAATSGSLARPSAPDFTAAPGLADGEVVITVSALPDWGDLTVPGDGGGSAGILQWWNGLTGWQALADPAATGAVTVTLPASFWGATTSLRVRGVSAAGVEGIAATKSVLVPPVPAGIGNTWPNDDTVWPNDDTTWPGE